MNKYYRTRHGNMITVYETSVGPAIVSIIPPGSFGAVDPLEQYGTIEVIWEDKSTGPRIYNDIFWSADESAIRDIAQAMTETMAADQPIPNSYPLGSDFWAL